VRRAACTALGKIGDPAAVPELIQCLEDADWSVRSAACTALGQIGDPAAVPALRVHAEVMQEARQALAKLGGTSMALQEAVCTLAEQSQWGVLCRALTSNQVRAAIVQLGSNAVPALIDVLRDDDPEIRRAACTVLGQIGNPTAVSELAKRLQDWVSDVRIAACTALGQIRDPSAVTALIACLDKRDISEAAANALVQIGKPAVPALTKALTSSKNNVRSAACTVLGKIGDPSAVPALIACLDQWDISEAAANALVQIGKPAVPALIEALTSPSNPVRIAACTALGQIGDPAAVPKLMKHLQDPAFNVRIAACTALGQIGDPSAVPALIASLDDRDISEAVTNALVQIGKPAVLALIEALTSPSNRVRRAACTALGEIGDPDAVPALRVHAEIMEEAQQALAMLGGTSMALQEAVRMLAEQSLWGVLCRALTSDLVRDAIVQLGSNAVPALMEALCDNNPKIRSAACTALGQIGDNTAVPKLIKCLNDNAIYVRIAACTALGQIGDPSAVPALIACLDQQDVSEAAANALVQIGKPAVPALIETLTNPSERVRIAACTALGQIRDASAAHALIACLDKRDISKVAANALVQIGKPAVPALIEALKSENDFVRRAACIALGQIGDPAAVSELAKCLQDSVIDIRIAACSALGQIRDASAAHALIACLDDLDISEAAANALVQIGKPAVPVLTRALTSSKNNMRSAACTVLGKIRDTAAVPVLIQCLKDTYSDVRCAACRALGKIRDTAAVPSLIEQLKDTNRDVRKAACTALGQVRDSSAVPALISLLCDEEVDVRITATDALVNIGKAAIPALQEAMKSDDPTIRKKVSGILNIIKQRMQR